MNHHKSVILFVAVALAGCESFDPPTTSNAPISQRTRTESAGSSNSASPKKGRVGYGTLATHYDRDGDGVFEEARRGKTIYFDRNGDRVADLIEQDTPPFRPFEWDADFDGILDHAITSEEGYVHRWTNRSQISKPSPQIFQQDRIGRSGTCELSEPKYRFWESLLGLDPARKAEAEGVGGNGGQAR